VQVRSLGELFLRQIQPLTQIAYALAQGRPEVVHGAASCREPRRLNTDYRLNYLKPIVQTGRGEGVCRPIACRVTRDHAPVGEHLSGRPGSARVGGDEIG
jgi:hypothetical protein